MQIDGLKLNLRVGENQLRRHRALLVGLSQSYLMSASHVATIENIMDMDPVGPSPDSTPGAPRSPEANTLLGGHAPTVHTSPQVPCSPPCSPQDMSESGITDYEAYLAQVPLGVGLGSATAEEQPTFAPSDDAPLANSLHAVLAQPADTLDHETSPSQALASWTQDMMAVSPTPFINNEDEEPTRGTPRRRLSDGRHAARSPVRYPHSDRRRSTRRSAERHHSSGRRTTHTPARRRNEVYSRQDARRSSQQPFHEDRAGTASARFHRR